MLPTKSFLICFFFRITYPTSTRRHGNFAEVHTLLRIILSSNSAVLINIITGAASRLHILTFSCFMFCVNVKEFPHDMSIIISVRTDLGDLSSGGRFHERAARYSQGVGPNVISRFNNGLSVF
jgi:hypothetical protein